MAATAERERRRRALLRAGSLLLAGAAGADRMGAALAASAAGVPVPRAPEGEPAVKLFVCGDVMTGRGIDQIMRHPVDPVLYEAYVRSAAKYVELAERANGRLPRTVDDRYVWGDALDLLDARRPDARIVNLETSVTTAGDPWPGKGVHYRMHPANAGCLKAAGIDCCALANNHVLDWGRPGLAETLATLRAAGVRTAGAGHDADEAAAPAIVPVPGKGRVLVFAAGTPDSGIPADWAAGRGRPGVWLLGGISPRQVDEIAQRVRAVRRDGDIVVFSIHWGGNWGYEISAAERAFAHGLVDEASIDVVHGHSSHHPRGIEVWHGRPILYGCGDFLDDYEGISGHEAYRAGLGFMYFPSLDRTGRGLARLELVPTSIRGFRVNRADAAEARWLVETMNREGRQPGTRIDAEANGALTLRWDRP